MPTAPVLDVTVSGIIIVVGPPRVGSIVAIAVTLIDMILDGVAYITGAIICPWGNVGFQVKIECLPPSVAGGEAIDRGALQHIAAGIPEVTNYYIPAVGRSRTGEIYMELVEETSLGYLEALPMAHVTRRGMCTKRGAIVHVSLVYL